MGLFTRLRQLDDRMVPDEGEVSVSGLSETKMLGMALAGVNVLVIGLALIPQPYNAPVALLLGLPLVAPYANLRLNRWMDANGS
jgi:hypothetical protein